MMARRLMMANVVEGFVTDQLMLNLDAIGYSGSGTNWPDSSGNSRDFTLIGSPTHNAATGFFTFDGSTQQAQGDTHANLFDSLSAITMEAWIRVPSVGYNATNAGAVELGNTTNQLTGSIATLRYGEITGAYADESFGGAISGSGVNRLSLVYRNGHTFLMDDVWHQLVYRGSTNNNELLLDGALVAVSRNIGTASTDGSSTGAILNTFRIMGRSAGGSILYAKGDCAIHRFYQKELSDSEVLQNFNAVKARFGL